MPGMNTTTGRGPPGAGGTMPVSRAPSTPAGSAG